MSRMCPFLMGTPRQNQSLLQRLRLGVEAGEKKVRVGFSDELDVEKKNGCSVARLVRSSCHKNNMVVATNREAGEKPDGYWDNRTCRRFD